MEDIFSVVWRGLAIGLFVSAPMGPVGILCIQRTLVKGRMTGLYTGVGAAISDFIYCLLTGFGLAFIEDFLEKNQNVIQLIGSFVLIAFAVYLFRKAPVQRKRRHEVESGSPGKDILGGFLFTFSNPLILFLIIGLFARFQFLGPGYDAFHYVIGYIAIVAGAMGWWWVVTYFVDKLRGVFNERTLKLINRGIGIVILIFALVGIVTGVGSMTASAAVRGADGLPSDSAMSVVPDRICFKTAATGRKSGWQLRLEGKAGRFVDLIMTPRITPEDPDPLYDSGRMPVEYDLGIYDESGKTLAELRKASGIPRGECSWKLTRNGDDWTLCWGAHHPDHGLRFKCPPFVLTGASYGIPKENPDFVSEGEVLPIYDFGVRGSAPSEYREEERENEERPDEEGERPASAWPDLAGIWTLHDYELDTDLLENGGDYVLEARKSTEGYEMIYHSGAVICPGSWKKGRVKAYLATRPGGVSYNVRWVDPEGGILGNGMASLDVYSGALVFQFPNRNAKIRFIRL